MGYGPRCLARTGKSYDRAQGAARQGPGRLAGCQALRKEAKIERLIQACVRAPGPGWAEGWKIFNRSISQQCDPSERWGRRHGVSFIDKPKAKQLLKI